MALLEIRTIISIFFLLVSVALAEPQQVQDRILGSVIYTIPGDAPLLSTPPTLSNLGVQQGTLAGSAIRQRYIDGGPSNITDVRRIPRLADKKDKLDHKMIEIMSTDDQKVFGTAMSFMQGLYPPTKGINGRRDIPQWPSISAVTTADYNYNWLAGAQECTLHQTTRGKYAFTTTYNTTHQETYPFYQALAPYFAGFPSAYMAYINAPTIYSAAEHLRSINQTFALSVSAADVARLRSLASQHVWDNYGRYSSGVPIPVVGGRMLAGKVLNELQRIFSSERSAPLSLLFGPVETLISFFSISGLSARQEFHELPLPGSSIIFELFTQGPPGPSEAHASYNPSTVWIRTFFRNGTGVDAELKAYPLFFRGQAGTNISLKDFASEMGKVGTGIPSNWCTACQSKNIYCPGFIAGAELGKKPDGSVDRGNYKLSCGKISNVGAGFIGAAIATVLLATLIAAIACCGIGGAAGRRKRNDDKAEQGRADATKNGNVRTWFFKRGKGRGEAGLDLKDATIVDSTELSVLGRPIPDGGVVVDEFVVAEPEPVSPLTVVTEDEERLKSRKDYGKSEEQLDREAELSANSSTRAAEVRHLV